MVSFAFSKMNRQPAREIHQDRASHEKFIQNNITEAKKYSALFIALPKKIQKIIEIQ